MNKHIPLIIALAMTACGGGTGSTQSSSADSDTPVAAPESASALPSSQTTEGASQTQPVDNVLEQELVEYRAMVMPLIRTGETESSVDTVRMRVQLWKHDEPVSVTALSEHFGSTDGCVAKRQSEAEHALEQQQFDARIPGASLVKGSHSVSVTSAMGTWRELPKVADGPEGLFNLEIEYIYGDYADAMYPENSSLNIIGDNFPVVDVTMPYLEPLTGLSITDNGKNLQNLYGDWLPASPNTVFAWDAAESENAKIAIILGTADTHEFGLDKGESPTSAITCIVEDSGRFTFPDDIKSQMDDEYRAYRLYRIIESFTVNNDALIHMIPVVFAND